MARPPLTPVDSSWVAAVGHDPAAKELWLQTNDGRVYVYSGVPRLVYNLLRDSASTGKGWWRLKVGNYPVRRG